MSRSGRIQSADARTASPDRAAVVAAEALLRHHMSDALVAEYLARTWPLDDHEIVAAIDAARSLLRIASLP